MLELFIPLRKGLKSARGSISVKGENGIACSLHPQLSRIQYHRKVHNSILSGEYDNFTHYAGFSIGKKF
jgi:hypothetical protein